MAKRKATERKRGRPPLRPEQRKRNNVTIRLRDDLKSKAQKAGASQGRSLSEEIEARLELSFSDHETRLRGFGSEGRLKLLRAFALAIDMIELETGEDAFADPETAEWAYELLTGMLDAAFAVRPGGPIDTVSPTEGQDVLAKHPAARTSMQNLRDLFMESVLPELPGALEAFRKSSKARREGGR